MKTQNILGTPDMVWTSPYTQQGDCILKKCGKFGVFQIEHEMIPNNSVVIPGNLVLKGQTNSHALYGGKFEILENGGVRFIRVTEATVLDHVKDHNGNRESAEHHAQWIPAGEYFFDGVLEYDHVLEESRQVID
jgi:hypothetical protein